MKKNKESQSDSRWIFPKELEDVYSDDLLKYFISEAETRLQDTVTALRSIRDRFYSLINITFAIIGVIITVILTDGDLTSVHLLSLSGLLLIFCIISAVLFYNISPYYQAGPGFKPSESISSETLQWMKYYHKDTSERSALFTILETKQQEISLNNRECARQLSVLNRISKAIRISLYVAAVFLLVSVTISLF